MASSNQRSTVAVATPLRAGGGEAPQYDKIDGVLEVEKLAEGTFMLHVKTLAVDSSDDHANNNNNNNQLDYQPGHVLALELEDTTSNDDNDVLSDDDTKKNGGWMRGPYTISRCTENSFDVMIRVVGKKSKAFVESASGTPVRFGGKFKVPILEGINNEEDPPSKIVLVSTGVGVGPCVGAIELALRNDSSSFPPIALFASYRKQSDVAYREHLDRLAAQHPIKFEWQPIITSEVGRLASCDENINMVSKSTEGLGITDTHYHLIGNGQMVNEWKQGLEEAGVPAERVTIEQYFNHKAEVDEAAIQRIASAISTGAAVEA